MCSILTASPQSQLPAGSQGWSLEAAAAAAYKGCFHPFHFHPLPSLSLQLAKHFLSVSHIFGIKGGNTSCWELVSPGRLHLLARLHQLQNVCRNKNSQDPSIPPSFPDCKVPPRVLQKSEDVSQQPQLRVSPQGDL